MIVCSRPDGGVSIIRPARECMTALCNGGGLIRPSEILRSVENWINAGLDRDIALRWCRAICYGGYVTAEALELLLAKDKPKDWTAPEVVPVPIDRWFRDAWTRHPNGGPIMVDLDRAKPIQAKKLAYHFKHERERVERANELALLEGRNYFEERPEIDLADLGRRVAASRSIQELRAVWPAPNA